jgi:pimeloyl-ACP methyl ester carboxylesterase
VKAPVTIPSSTCKLIFCILARSGLAGRAGAPVEETGMVFKQPCNFLRWPQIPIRVMGSANDRFFPLEFQRRVARARLKTDIHAVPGGHLVALSNPEGLVEQFLGFEREYV